MAKQTTNRVQHLLDPEALAKLQRLGMNARTVVRGPISGRHRSSSHGFSVEFAEHRQYTPGDDIRHVDWRVWGKRDRYFIQQYEEETNLRATIVLDVSASMGYTGTLASTYAGQQLSKFSYGRLLAASLAHLLVHQQDAVALATFDTKLRRFISASSRPGHLRVLLNELVECEPGNETRLAPMLHTVAERIPQRGLVILISDLLDDPDDLIPALHHFRQRKHDVIVLHTLAEEEITFPFYTARAFRDMETGSEFDVDPRRLRMDYLERVNSFLDQIRTGCGRSDIDYTQIITSEPFDRALEQMFAKRERRWK